MKNISSCDVAVVGAGPAGATAAFLLAKSRRKVLLLDKHTFPRPKLCAGLLTWKTIDLIEQIYGTTLNQLNRDCIIRHACRDYRIYFGRNEIARGRLDFPFHFVDRLTYDHYWLQRAQQAGAHVETGNAVMGVDPIQGALTLADGRRVHAGLIIGADGVWSKVRNAIPRQLISEKRRRQNMAATIETHRPHTNQWVAPHYASLHFGFLPWGYGWSFPGPVSQTVGVAGLVQKGDCSLIDSFHQLLKAMDIDQKELNPLRGYPLPYGNYLKQPTYEKILLIGDACGLADPLLGEGIYYAHRSAQIAAQAIIKAGARTSKVPRIYHTELNHHILRELRWINLFRNALFIGGERRHYRGLKLFFRLFPKRLEACIQGQRSFARLLFL